MSTSIFAKIESYDVQPNGIVRPSAIFKLFQKAAGDDLDNFNMSFELLHENNIAFVLTKLTIKFYDNINVYDDIKIITRPRNNKGVYFIRDYDLFVNGNRVAYATSHWVIIDVSTRKLLRPDSLSNLGEIPPDLTECIVLDDKRIKFDENSLQRTDVREVYYSQIDRNGHMNNTFYPDIVFDYLPDSFKSSLKDKTITVYYISELMQGQKFDVFTLTTDTDFRFLAKNSITGKDIFTALIDFWFIVYYNYIVKFHERIEFLWLNPW